MPARKRHDPPAGTTAGYRPLDKVLRRDPDRDYVWANPNDQMTGQALYESMGYTVVEYSADGPKPLVGSVREGQPITMMGGPVLMSAPISVRKDLEAATAQQADAIARRIRPGNDGGLDGFRGGQNYKVRASVTEEG